MTGCATTRHPDLTILNNGIALVAFENMSDQSIINIRQFKTSIINKIHPHRKLQFEDAIS